MFGIHNHQPVGNFDYVFHTAYNDCYLPFIEMLERHPKIRMSLHFTGSLLEWIEKNHSEYFNRLRGLLSKKQVEIIGGGFYEPILPVIPTQDALGQISMMQDYIKDRFGVTPRGMWLAERVWEPELPSLIKKAGLEYTAIDDTHFYYAGFNAEDMSGYYITEAQGNDIRVFPIDKGLRYRIPFKLPGETIDYLKQISNGHPDAGITLADDGEKFGLWPGTYKWVYKEGYLESLFRLLEENSSWINMLTFSEYMDRYPANGKAYLPTASYDEMMEWSLPVESQIVFKDIINNFQKTGQYDKLHPYIRGGFWRNFLTKYPESNKMYSKMLYVSKKINTARLKPEVKKKALSELYKSQCNCVYWHGLFGGIYLNYLRHAVYYHLLGAENLIGQDRLEIEKIDYNLDGKDEILILSSMLNLYLAPSCGGHIIELDYRPKQFNLTNTFTRRKEAYHYNMGKTSQQDADGISQPKSIHNINYAEEGLKNILDYDWYKRDSLIDHILDGNTDIKGFRRCHYGENGDFVNQAYRVEKSDETGIILSRQGRIYIDGAEFPFSIKKGIKINSGGNIAIDYELFNSGRKALNIWFGVEFNLSFLAGSDAQRYFAVPERDITAAPMGTVKELGNVKEMHLADKYTAFNMRLKWIQPALLWIFPIETASHSESGLERTYQGSCIMPSWKFDLAANDKIGFNLTIAIGDI